MNGKLQLSSIAAYTDYHRQTETFMKDFVAGTSTPGSQAGQQDISTFKSFLFRNTLNYIISSKVSLQPGIDITHEKAGGARISGSPIINDYAFFISSEIKPTSKINIRPGLRFIKNSVYDAPPVVPSVNAKFVLNKALDLRVAYAYGFRSPALRELYFNFLDANHTIIGNPDLKAEHSNSFNGSLTANWNPDRKNNLLVTSTLGGFYNVFNDLITYASSPTSSDTTITVNIAKFKTTGVTLENVLQWKDLSATIGFSYIGRYNEFSDDDNYKAEDLPSFVWSPEFNSNIIYTVKKIKTSFGLFYKFTGKRPGYLLSYNNSTAQDELLLTNVQAFHWADATVTKPLFKYFTLNAGVKNIFDVTDLSNSRLNSGGAHSTGGPVPMNYGRSYFLGLTFQWNKK
jgi:outer membrane receptor for ferrienterochelin and colicins